MATKLNTGGFLVHPGDYRKLFSYKKTVILYDMTVHYIGRFLTPSDRTYDQMKQAARSGKQNIVEGLEDNMTSKDTGLHLVNVARSSLQELREDYEDQLRTNGLELWTASHKRYDGMLHFCSTHHEVTDYSPFYEKWDRETLCNTALTLIHQADKGLMKLLQQMEAAFLAEGGVREQMTAARKAARGY